jgi:hypothetical protein
MMWGLALLAATFLFGWAGAVVWSQPEDGTDGAAMFAFSLFSMAMAALAGALLLVGYVIWRRLRAPRPAPTQMWRHDPWRQGRWRYWDGTAWTDHIAD